MVPPPGQPDFKDLFLENLPAIEKILARVARRNALIGDEADEFASWAQARLIDNDYAALRKYQGRAGMETFLTVVIRNLYLDYRVQQWGRWRASMAAKRQGDEALQLEVLIHRDKYTLAQAGEIMRSRGWTRKTDRELATIAATFPPHERHSERSDTPMPETASSEQADTALWREEDAREWDSTRAALKRAIGTLPPLDRAILRLRFWEGESVANVARTLRLDQKPLYRHIERVLADLRAELEREGLNWSDVAGILGAEGLE